MREENERYMREETEDEGWVGERALFSLYPSGEVTILHCPVSLCCSYFNLG